MKKIFGTAEESTPKDPVELTNIPVEVPSNPPLSIPPKNLFFEGIYGLDDLKNFLYKTVINPGINSEDFSYFPHSVLLFGPGGNGKTMIGNSFAKNSPFTFLNIAASELVVNNGTVEGLKELFQQARNYQPSIIFIDEADLILANQNFTTPLIAEFKIQMNQIIDKDSQDKIFIIACTNFPQNFDDSTLRRFKRKFFVDLPNKIASTCIIHSFFKGSKISISPQVVQNITSQIELYSAADIINLCEEMKLIARQNPISMDHFISAKKSVKPSLSLSKYEEYQQWNSDFGSEFK